MLVCVQELAPYLTFQSQGRNVGDADCVNVDCREEQKWLPISRVAHDVDANFGVPTK